MVRLKHVDTVRTASRKLIEIGHTRTKGASVIKTMFTIGSDRPEAAHRQQLTAARRDYLSPAIHRRHADREVHE